jgi:hypothetical protein
MERLSDQKPDDAERTSVQPDVVHSPQWRQWSDCSRLSLLVLNRWTGASGAAEGLSFGAQRVGMLIDSWRASRAKIGESEYLS